MFCMKCDKHLSNCTCPDLNERLSKIAQSPHVAVKFCKKCREHHARCTCAAPDWEIRGGRVS